MRFEVVIARKTRATMLKRTDKFTLFDGKHCQGHRHGCGVQDEDNINTTEKNPCLQEVSGREFRLSGGEHPEISNIVCLELQNG